jgi:hypothetical protein
MMKKIAGALFALLIGAPAYGQQVQQSGTITARHLPAWVAPGVIGDAGTSADSPISSIGATGQICSNSARVSSGAWASLCLQANTNSPSTISLQNNGASPNETLQFIVNGTTFPFPGSLANITIGTTPVVGGTNSLCLFVSGGFVGQQTCTLSAITSLTGDGTATGPGASIFTLSTVNSNTGTFGSGALVPIITVNGKGLITSVSTASVGLTVGSSTISSGATNSILYQNGTVLGELTVVGNAVLSTNVSGVPSLSTTLPSGLTVPSPTFTGTETFPDSATWTSTGISKVAALSVGSATLPSGGNVSISGQYQVNGTQIAASNLSDGKTGTGSLVGAVSPAISGTWTGSPTFSGNITFSGQLIETGTSPPSSAGGQSYMMGTVASPTLTNTGQLSLYNTLVNGGIIQGDGSTNDVSIFNKGGTLVMGVPTGTTKLNLPSLSVGTCSSGLALDSGNNTVLTSCPGSSASIQVGTTTIASGTSGRIEFNNAGVLGELIIGNGLSNASGTLISSILTEPQGRITLQANTPVMTTSQSAQTTLRYDCYTGGGQIPYFNGTIDQIDTITSCEVTDAMVSAASAGQVVSANVYDVWWVHSGTNRICLAMSASTGGGGGWSADTGGSNTARGTGYSQLDRTTRPYTTNKNAIANCFNGATNYGSVSANQATYLGTVFASANGQISYTFGAAASGGTAALLGVWNMYNRVTVTTTVTDNGTSYSYSSATVRQARASAGNQIQFVLGVQEDGVQFSYAAKMLMSATSQASASWGVGFDVTNAFSIAASNFQSGSATQVSNASSNAGVWSVGVGLHTLAATESSDGSNGNGFDSGSLNSLMASIRM